MSHFDDIEPLFWGDGPKAGAGCALFAVVVIAAIVWAVWSDGESERLCKQYGEKYVDSNSRYTLCERADGTVVKR